MLSILGGNQMTKYCSNCGAELDDNVKFCSECGSQVDKKKDAPKKTVIVEEIDEKEYKKKNQSFDEMLIRQPILSKIIIYHQILI